MATVDLSEQIKELGATLTSIEKVLDLDAMRAEITKLQEEVGAPDLWDDQANAQRVTGRLSVLQADLERITGLRQRLDDLEIMVQLGQEESDAGQGSHPAEHAAAGELLYLPSARLLRALPAHTQRVRLIAVEEAGEAHSLGIPGVLRVDRLSEPFTHVRQSYEEWAAEQKV